jgi:hypothetical protein
MFKCPIFEETLKKFNVMFLCNMLLRVCAQNNFKNYQRSFYTGEARYGRNKPHRKSKYRQNCVVVKGFYKYLQRVMHDVIIQD